MNISRSRSSSIPLLTAGRHGTGRAMDRMRLALRAYDKRAERRAALDGWLAACAALSSTA